MQIHSLGYRTDLIFPRFDGQLLDRADYLVILTPSNPTFYWGNFILFPDPPGEGDFEKWKGLFAREVAARLPVKHLAFGWDTVRGRDRAGTAISGGGFQPEPVGDTDGAAGAPAAQVQPGGRGASAQPGLGMGTGPAEPGGLP